MLEVENGAETTMKRLGGNVRRARRAMNVSQQALGARAALCRGDVVDFERGSRNFRIFTVVRLAGALGVDLAQLFSGVESWYVRPLPAPEYDQDRPPTKVERDDLLIRLWREGRPERDIAEALDLEVASVGPYVRELRDAGVHLDYRRPPRGMREASARRRRNSRGPGDDRDPLNLPQGSARPEPTARTVGCSGRRQDARPS